MPAEFTLSPVQTTDVDIGKNVTLYCNASGDPHPSITWTKDGISSMTFNVSGPVLHLPNAQRKDVGFYRCSAFNGYGPVISKVGLVNVKCGYFFDRRFLSPILNPFTPDSDKSKIDKFSKITNWVKLTKKQHQLLDIEWSHLMVLSIESKVRERCITQGVTLGVIGLRRTSVW